MNEGIWVKINLKEIKIVRINNSKNTTIVRSRSRIQQIEKYRYFESITRKLEMRRNQEMSWLNRIITKRRTILEQY